MNQAERVASLPAPPVRRPAADIAAALPADPFARQPWWHARGGRRLSGRPAVFVLASLIVALLASSAAPTPLYAIYQAQWHFTPITTTVVFGVYAMAVLAALLTLGKLSDHVGRRPVLLTAIAVPAGSLVIFATATGVPALLSARVVQGLSTGAALGAIGAAMLDMDRELGTFANAVAPGMGTATGAIVSALAIHHLDAREKAELFAGALERRVLPRRAVGARQRHPRAHVVEDIQRNDVARHFPLLQERAIARREQYREVPRARH